MFITLQKIGFAANSPGSHCSLCRSLWSILCVFCKTYRQAYRIVILLAEQVLLWRLGNEGLRIYNPGPKGKGRRERLETFTLRDKSID